MTDPYTPEYELESTTFNILNIDKFREFLIENKVFVTAVGLVIGKYLEMVSDSFFDNLVLPIFNKDSDKDGVNDFQHLIDYTIETNGMKFKIGQFIYDLFKFGLILYILFVAARLARDLLN